ncbi:MAG: CRISPR-associated endoribonuclease Cas6 [Aquificaceae bacterium]
MRLRILAKTTKLPIIYRHRILALLKEAIESSNRQYKELLYADRKPKPFTFSVLFPRGTALKKEAFPLSDGIEIVDYVFYFPEDSYFHVLLSSSDYEFLINLYNGLLKIRAFPFNKDIKIDIFRIIPVDKKPVISNKAVFKTLSPILIEDKEGKPIFGNDKSFDMDVFNRELNEIQDRILITLRGKGLKKRLAFEPIRWKKQVVKHTLSKVLEGYAKGELTKPYITLTCFEGCFKLEGDQEDLEMIYHIGLGLRTGQGFGMVEVVG